MKLTTNYMGLSLKSPLVLGASPLSEDIDNIKRAEDVGAGAIVIHLLFEEQLYVDTQLINPLVTLENQEYSLVLTDLPISARFREPEIGLAK